MKLVEERRTELASAYLLAGPFVAMAGHSISDIWLSVFALVFLIWCAATDNWARLNVRWVHAALVFWFWLLLASAFSDWPRDSFSQSLPWIRFPIFAAGFAALLSTSPQLQRRFIYSCMAGVVAMMVILLVERLRNPDALRLYGTMGQGPKAGWYLFAFGVPVLFWSLYQLKESVRAARWALPLCIAILFSMFSTGEVYSSLILVFATVVFLLLLQPPLWIVGAGAAGVIVASTALYLTNPELLLRFTVEAMERLPWLSTSDYYVPWFGGLWAGVSNWLTGVGPDNLDPYCKVLAPDGLFRPSIPVENCPTHPHNLYIQAFAETGIVGLSLFLLLVFCLIRGSWRWAEIKASDFAAMASLTALLAVFWPISAYSEAFGQHKNFFSWVLIAWCLALQAKFRWEAAVRTKYAGGAELAR